MAEKKSRGRKKGGDCTVLLKGSLSVVTHMDFPHSHSQSELVSGLSFHTISLCYREMDLGSETIFADSEGKEPTHYYKLVTQPL